MNNCKAAASFVLLLLFITLHVKAQIYDQALEMHRKNTKIAFLRLLSEVSNQLTDTTLTVEKHYSLLDPIIDYADREKAEFTRLRRAYFQNIASPPAFLHNLNFDTLAKNEVTAMLQDRKFTTISLLQCYQPMEITSVIMGLTQPLIYQQNNVEISQAGIVHTFGSQVFVNDVGKNVWEIWAINRLYSLRFNLDLNTMQVGSIAYSKPSRSGHLPLKLPYIIQKRKYELDKLYQEMDRIRWNSYSEHFPVRFPYYISQDSVAQSLADFYQKNQFRFLKVQRELLDDLETAVPLDSTWQQCKDTMLHEYPATKRALMPYIIHPNEVAFHLFSSANGMPPFNSDYQEIGKNAMLGFFNYSMGKTGKYCWRVQSKSYSIAFEYVWNIKDGSFSDLKVFKRKAGH